MDGAVEKETITIKIGGRGRNVDDDSRKFSVQIEFHKDIQPSNK